MREAQRTPLLPQAIGRVALAVILVASLHFGAKPNIAFAAFPEEDISKDIDLPIKLGTTTIESIAEAIDRPPECVDFANPVLRSALKVNPVDNTDFVTDTVTIPTKGFCLFFQALIGKPVVQPSLSK